MPKSKLQSSLTDVLGTNNHFCTCVNSINDILQQIYYSSETADLFIIDYTSYDHDLFNIFQYSVSKNTHIPIVFYNSPVLVNFPDYCAYWQYINAAYFYKTFNTETYTPIFLLIEQVCREHTGKISACTPGRTGPTSSSPAGQQGMTKSVHDIISNYELDHSSAILLELLYANKNSFVSKETILDYFKSKGYEITKSTLYSYISRLKNRLAAAANENIHISRTYQGYKLILQ